MTDWWDLERFGDLPRRAALRYGAREGLVFQDRRYSFEEVAAETDRTARALMSAGVGKGDHVALWLNNSDHWVFIMAAVARIGAVLVPINTRFRANDLDYVLRQSDSAFLIAHDRSGPIDYLAIVREVVDLPDDGTDVRDAKFPELRRVFVLGDGGHSGVEDWNATLGRAAETTPEALEVRAADVSPQNLAFIMYTSGTTGFPKGAMHDHRAVRNVEERGFRMGMTVNDTILNYLPLFHLFGFSEGPLMSFLSGARHIVTETFDPDASLDLVEQEGVTIVHGFEAHVKGLTEAQEARARDVSSLRTGVFAAGPHSATPIIRKAQRVLAPIRSISGFGMTEIWIGAGFNAPDDSEEQRCEASGYVGLGYDLRVIDPETGGEQGPGAEGELQVRGRYLMLGYYKKPDETAASYAEGGWFKTGDAAMWRDDGFIRFLGRYKDMLKVGGENVDPMEVEGLLLERADVHQVAVVGRPHPTLSEVAVAYVEPAPGTKPVAEEIIAFCRGKVASFKIPRDVVFVDGFPMTASGKIRKVELRADAVKRFKAPTRA